MTARFSLLALLAFPVVAVAFVLISAASLPPVVAAHFTSGGTADGYMPRGGYVILMAGLVAGLPLFLAAVSSAVRLVPARCINLPERDYWLAPGRRAETLAFIQRQGLFFAVALDAFLCFVHWLVILANARTPPLFPELLFTHGAFVFLAVIAVWIVIFIVSFGRKSH